jgi:anti-anti-sigma regulatory factor
MTVGRKSQKRRATNVVAGSNDGATAASVVAKPTGVLQLGSSLSIREVGEYSQQLKAMLDAGPMDIDASQIETIDTAGLQWLLVAAAAAQRRGFKLKLRGAQSIKDGAACSLGLQQHLGELVGVLP